MKLLTAVMVLTLKLISDISAVSCQESYSEVLRPREIRAESENGTADLYKEIGVVCQLLESIAELDSLTNKMGKTKSLQLRAISSMGAHIQSNMCSWANEKLHMYEQLEDKNGVCAVDKLMQVCLQVRAYNIASNAQPQ